VDIPGITAHGFKTEGLALASRYITAMNRVIDACPARPDKIVRKICDSLKFALFIKRRSIVHKSELNNNKALKYMR
jgi:hypothetical protein